MSQRKETVKMKLSSMQKEMLRSIPSREYKFMRDNQEIHVRAFKVGEMYILHKTAPDEAGTMCNSITRNPVELHNMMDPYCPEYEEIEY